MAQNLTELGAKALDLDHIRGTLIRLEDTIIFSLIERAQFAHNPKIYRKGAFETLSKKESFLGWMLRETEIIHAKVRRYESPDETPFHPRSTLPPALLTPLAYPPLLHPNDVDVNAKIYDWYTEDIVPAITVRKGKGRGEVNGDGEGEDDQNYGSSATRDVEALQAISRRIHYGKFVSESKFRSAPHDFVPHILTPNPPALEALITKPSVEAALLKRLRRKAGWYGRELDPSTGEAPAPNEGGEGEREGRERVRAEEVVRMYEKWIIPLTKEVEVEYLLKRLDGLSADEVERLKKAPEA